MRNPILIVLLFMLAACASSKPSFRRSKPIATYYGMEDMLGDGYLTLKENGYFRYYEKRWVVFMVKMNEYHGRYSRKDDTIILDWLDADPKKIKYFLSKKCVVKDSSRKIWFVDETNGRFLWGLSLVGRK